MFAQYGMPEIVRSDIGLQFSAQGFDEFTKTPKSNDQTEKIIQTMKNILKKWNAEDLIWLFLTWHHVTPVMPHPWCKLGTAASSMGKHIHTLQLVPVMDDHVPYNLT